MAVVPAAMSPTLMSRASPPVVPAAMTDPQGLARLQRAVPAGVKLTVLPLLLKACAHLLKELPDFNSSLAPSGKAIIRKKYVHIGFAVDTPDGLLVPVIRDVDQKSLLQLAAEEAAAITDAGHREAEHLLAEAHLDLHALKSVLGVKR